MCVRACVRACVRVCACACTILPSVSDPDRIYNRDHRCVAKRDELLKVCKHEAGTASPGCVRLPDACNYV